MLEEKLVAADELKEFLGNIFCECYADLDKHREDLSTLEGNFPMYSERTECASTEKPLWGEVKLGRLPEFLYDDVRNSSTREGNSPSHSVQTD